MPNSEEDDATDIAEARRSTNKRKARHPFRSLRNPQYRLWAAGAFVSNVGTWMQRTAQDWLVLAELTQHSAVAVGWVTALQFGPQILFLPWTGYAADRLDQRRLVRITQAALGTFALILGLLTTAGWVQLWQVYILAFASGTAAAFDTPVRAAFIADLVGEEDLPNAVALNSISFNAGRMIGPAVAGLCIASWGSGWAICANGISFLAVLASVSFIRPARRRSPLPQHVGSRDALIEGLQYIVRRDDLRTIMLMLVLIGMLGLNFPIFISTMAVSVFGMQAGSYGLLTSLMAIGTTIGALLAAGREKPSIGTMTMAATFFGLGLAIAATMPRFWWFGAILLPVGIASNTLVNVSNSLLQTASAPSMRGRVIAIRMSVLSGLSFLGGPIVGKVADALGPRWAVALGAAAGFGAAMIGFAYVQRSNTRRAGAE